MIHPTELLQKVNLLLVMSNEFKSFTLMFNWNCLEQAVVFININMSDTFKLSQKMSFCQTKFTINQSISPSLIFFLEFLITLEIFRGLFQQNKIKNRVVKDTDAGYI